MIYYYPNRPLMVSRNQIERFGSDPDWIAEIKKNGDRLCLFHDKGHFQFWNRHHSILKYIPIKTVLDELSLLRLPDGVQLDGELIHNHTKKVKNIIYLYDIYQWKGEKIKEKLSARHEMLEDIMAGKVFRHITLARQYINFDNKLFDEVIKQDENEGFVMKNINGKLTFTTTSSVDVEWQVKVRKS